MKLQQLQYVLEIVKQGYNISTAANGLYTYQPSVSRQLQQFEEELGFAIFERSRNHIGGLTPAGAIVVDIAKRIMNDVNDLGSLKDDLMSSNRGTLTIATTHTVANYVLPDVIGSFIKAYPEVQVVLIQSDPEGICLLVEEGDADLAIGTESRHRHPRLIELPCYALDRVVVVPTGHPLTEKPELTLEDVAQFPIITYDQRYSGSWKVHDAFQAAGLQPKIALSAIDAGVCKTYVQTGLGIAVLTSVTFDAARDTGLVALPAGHLFESSTTSIKLRANTYLRPYLLDFVHRFSPRLRPEVVRDLVQHGTDASADRAATLPAQQSMRGTNQRG